MRYVMVVATGLVLAVSGSAAGATGTETRQALTAIKAPLPPDAGSHYQYYLTQIACASRLDCAATGLLSTSPAADRGVLLVEKAGKWTVSEPPLPRQMKPRGNSAVVPGAVSCPAVGRCVAVAWAYTDVQEEALIFTQRKTGWRETILPVPAGADGARLTLVSCPSPGDCTAAGTFRKRSGGREGLLVRERAGRWARPVAAPLPRNAAKQSAKFLQEASIDSLSCPSARGCAAVGTYTNTHGSSEGMLLTAARGRWARGVEARLPANVMQTEGSDLYPVLGLGSVSCSSVNDCTAVGGYVDDRGNQSGMTLSEHAGRWAPAQETPLPANAGPNPQQGNVPDSPMNAVACPSSGVCSAIGAYVDNSGNTEVLLLDEQGGAWTPSALVLPSGVAETQGGFLDSLACSSPGNCVAVGGYDIGLGAYKPLLATEQSGRWLQGTAAPLPAGVSQRDTGFLNSVSCPSATACVAVGGYIGSGRRPAQGGLIVSRG
jgi:hypothetical protein